MRKKICYLLLALLILITLSSCRSQPEVEYSYIDGTWGSFFDVFWNNMNKNYVMFSLDYSDDKWDRVYDKYSPQFYALGNIEDKGTNSVNNEKALRMIFDIVKELADGHYAITINDKNKETLFYFPMINYRVYKQLNISDDDIFKYCMGDNSVITGPTAFDEKTSNIIQITFGLDNVYDSEGNEIPQTGELTNGHVDGVNDCYVFREYRNNDGNTLDAFYAILDNETLYLSFSGYSFLDGSEEFIDYFVPWLTEDTIKNIIIDLRGNGGGNANEISDLFSSLIDKDIPIIKVREKDGPNRNDFTPYREEIFSGTGTSQSTKPIAVLFNRASISSAESNILTFKAMRDQCGMNIKFFGSGNSAGGLCSILHYTDSNGNYTLQRNAGPFQSLPYLSVYTPNQNCFTYYDGTCYEKVGVTPDYLIPFDQSYITALGNKNDQLFHMALNWVRSQK